MAEGDLANDPLLGLAQYGALGIVVMVLIIYARSSIARERERADKAEQQVLELNEFIRAELLPKQVETTLIYKQVTEALEDSVHLLTELKYRENYRRDEVPRSRRVD